jgi:hypothetical protein
MPAAQTSTLESIIWLVERFRAAGAKVVNTRGEDLEPVDIAALLELLSKQGQAK